MKDKKVKKLAIITTHPIQYNAPIFRMLHERGIISLKVFYTWSQVESEEKYDPGFGKNVRWDIPLLEGYDYTFTSNISKSPGSHHFKGIINPFLIKEIEEWQAEAIFVFGWSFQSHLKIIRHFHKRIPVYFRGDSTLMRKEGNLRQIARTYFLRWVYSHVDIAFYVGTENKKYFIKHGFKESNLEFAPHAVDNKRFSDENGQYTELAANWQRELGISDKELVCVYAGKLETVKNPDFIIQLAEKARGLPIRFLIIGNGPLELFLKKKAKEFPQVTFLDFQNQSKMPIVYRLGQVFLLPSRSETWGLSVNEAMACSRIILVNDQVGCATDLVKNGSNGFVFKAGEVNDAFNKLELLLHGGEKLGQMASTSGKIIQQWSYEKICAAIEKRFIHSNF